MVSISIASGFVVKYSHMKIESTKAIQESNNKKITVLIADDHPLMREALRGHLKKHDDFKVIAEVSNGEDAVKMATMLNPDVIVMDISMPGINGIEATRKIKTQCPRINILALTVHNDYERILGILAAGASGYITKAAMGEEIVEAVRSVHAGETVLSTPVSQELIKYALRNNTQPASIHLAEKLTHKEIEVLKLVANGKSNKDIARHLGLSIPTVKGHLADIFTKLNVSSRTEAVIAGLRTGYIRLQDIEEK
jgi:DNA-binding NarL/FixJ family response regulator